MKLFIKYPRVIPLAFGKFSKMSDYISKSVEAEFKRPRLTVRTRGFEICLDPEDNSGICAYISAVGFWELAATELFCKVLKKGMTVVDVGANIGWFSMLSAKMVGETGKVYAFEPEPKNHSLLAKSARLNDFAQILLQAQCVSDTDGSLTLYLSSTSGTHSIVRQSGSSISVPSVTLDTFALRNSIDHIDMLKVDVEGAEARVIQGAQKLLADSKIDAIVMEWNPEGWAQHQNLLADLARTFGVHRIVSSSPFLIKQVQEVGELPALTNLFLKRMDK